MMHSTYVQNTKELTFNVFTICNCTSCEDKSQMLQCYNELPRNRYLMPQFMSEEAIYLIPKTAAFDPGPSHASQQYTKS